jgi:hypothetical protein
MGTALIARIGIAVVLAAVLAAQARRLTGQPHRRRAFLMGAGALLCFAGFIVTLGAGGGSGALQGAMAIAGMALFVGAALSLVLSLRSGERAGDHARISAAAQAYRAKREREQADKLGDHK